VKSSIYRWALTGVLTVLKTLTGEEFRVEMGIDWCINCFKTLTVFKHFNDLMSY
jgi:hypothetical protein